MSALSGVLTSTVFYYQRTVINKELLYY